MPDGDGRVQASLNVIYLEQAMNPAKATQRFAPELQRAAREIPRNGVD